MYMNTNPAISILVPVYKVEAYLQRCIDSVLTQDFTDWEMILVDDGSPDGCPQICDEAAKKDGRIKVVHKENGGLPSARLAGFREAKGEYLLFLDSDDWLLEGALTILYDEITKGDYDIVRSMIHIVDEKGNEKNEHYQYEDGTIKGYEAYQEMLYTGEIAPYLHSAIYHKRIFCSSVFDKLIKAKISIGEDWVTNLFVSHNVEHVLFIPNPTYAYFVNKSSYMRSNVMGREYASRIDQCISGYVSSANETIKKMFVLNQVRGIINRDFQKEIPFSRKDYHYVIDYIKNDENEKALYSSLPYKNTLFLRNLPLYFIYSRVFAYCKWIKGGMRDKKVI